MTSVRTKLVLAQLLITLLPVFPLYLLVKSFLEQSLEIGLNKRVESALEQATGISKTLYAAYKDETLVLAKEWAASDEIRQLLAGRQPGAATRIQALPPGGFRISLYDSNGRLLFDRAPDSADGWPEPNVTDLREVASTNEAGFLEESEDPQLIRAFAPVQAGSERRGVLLVTRQLDPDFGRAAQQIVDVHQMFKTLGWIRDDLKRSFLLAFFAVYTPFALLSIAVGYFLSRKIASPVVALAEATQQVAGGDWNVRLETRSKDEVGKLVQAFNTMVRTLKEKQDHLVALEKMAVWREIARVLAHEIKNPLTPIQLTVQQMKDKYPGDDPEYARLLAECSGIVNDEIDSLRKLVREFSEFARMPKLNLALGDLNELAREVARMYPTGALQLEIDPELPEVRFDYEQVRRALINLIENALDSIASMESGRVTIATHREGEWVVLAVADNGGGIPADLTDKIFEPYFSTKKSGVGLGLAIVKRIVEEHGGSIFVESSEGKGARFTLRFPAENS